MARTSALMIAVALLIAGCSGSDSGSSLADRVASANSAGNPVDAGDSTGFDDPGSSSDNADGGPFGDGATDDSTEWNGTTSDEAASDACLYLYMVSSGGEDGASLDLVDEVIMPLLEEADGTRLESIAGVRDVATSLQDAIARQATEAEINELKGEAIRACNTMGFEEQDKDIQIEPWCERNDC